MLLSDEMSLYSYVIVKCVCLCLYKINTTRYSAKAAIASSLDKEKSTTLLYPSEKEHSRQKT